MPFKYGSILRIIPILVLTFAVLHASAEGSDAGSVRGTVTDPSGAVIPNATVHLTNEVSGLDRTVSTNATGQFVFANIPFNPYRIIVSADGFAPSSRSFEIRSVVGANLNLVLQVAGQFTDRYGGVFGRPGRDRPHLSHGCGPRTVHQGAAGKPVFFA